MVITPLLDMQSVTLPQPITRENKSRIRLQTVFEMWKIEIRILLYVFANFLQSESNITVLTDVQKKRKKKPLRVPHSYL